MQKESIVLELFLYSSKLIDISKKNYIESPDFKESPVFVFYFFFALK